MVSEEETVCRKKGTGKDIYRDWREDETVCRRNGKERKDVGG